MQFEGLAHFVEHPVKALAEFAAERRFDVLVRSFDLRCHSCSELRGTPIGVIEVVPPAVKTNLGGAHQWGEDLDTFADSIVEQIIADAAEASFGQAHGLLRASREVLDATFEGMNAAYLKSQ